MTRQRSERTWICLSLAALVAAALAPLVLAPFYVRVGQLVLYSAALGLAWAILGGFAGYWSFGQSAFIGIGAFVGGLAEAELATAPPALQFLVGLAAGSAACAVIAALLAYPVLRLRGIYFAIAMLGVAHVFAELNNNIDIFQGSLGLTFPNIGIAGLDPHVFYYELFLVAAAATLLAAWLIRRSRFGYGLLSIREDEDTARMLGVPTEHYKAAAFVVSAVIAGVLGLIYAHSLGYITTGSVYRDDTNLNAIVYSLLGGMGTLIGPIIGAAILVVLTHVVLGDFLDFHMFATGLLLVLLVLLAPSGLVGLARKLVGRKKVRR
ncbi:MAG TPA: branched-chain amino acid ABC transporter permease [Stellaceae bacterium]|nr:branched-chain amino acid ABC transporter permease [Stellaceae bacterium]